MLIAVSVGPALATNNGLEFDPSTFRKAAGLPHDVLDGEDSFAVEYWVYYSSATGTIHTPLYARTASTTREIQTGFDHSSDLYYYYGAAGSIQSQGVAPALPADEWVFVSFQFDGTAERPSEFGITAAYPNQFNPSTTVVFALPRAEHVTAVIYDLTGREVARLAEREFTAGRHALTWNAGETASGVYLVRVRADRHASTRKIVLIR